MNIDPNSPAFPVPVQHNGMTVRAYLAAHAPAISDSEIDPAGNNECEADDYLAARASYAVRWADALIAELNKSTS